MDRLHIGIGMVACMLVGACGGGDGPSDDPFAASMGGPGFGDEGGSDGDDGDGDGLDDDGDGGPVGDDGGSGDDGAPGDDGGAAEDGGSDGGDAEPPAPMGLCFETPPAGAPQPPSPKDYSGGSCPAIMPGNNTGFQSDGRSREFIFVAPSDHDPTKSYPLVIAWHHINGTAADYLDYLDAQALSDERQMMFAIPQDSGMFEASWPFTPLDNNQAEVDLVFFDDMLACIHEQYNVNLSCVSSAGVSAGGLWTAFLGQRRGNYLASNLVFSGGYPTENFGAPWWSWQDSPHTFASLVVWGGPSDVLGIDFHAASLNYIDHLEGDGHFIVKCEHDQGHGAPPPGEGQTEPPIGALFDFVLQHPYWYEGTSIYETEPPPADMPSYCELP